MNIEVNKQGLERLLESEMYSILVHYGRDVPYDNVVEFLRTDDIDVPEEMIRNNYEFACDLYDENEKDGWNDEVYPNRKSKKADAPLSEKIFKTMLALMTDRTVDNNELMPAAPNSVSDAIHELVCKETERKLPSDDITVDMVTCDIELADKVSDAAFELASLLVTTDYKYR